jgi:hypothetical protein
MAGTGKDLFRTVIVFEVLHEGIIPSDMDLADIVRETIHGAFSGKWQSNSQRLSDDAMATALEAQGSDPALLLGEDWNAINYENRTKTGPEEGEE